MRSLSSVATLVSPDQTTSVDEEDSYEQKIGFPVPTYVDLRRIETSEFEWPESGSLIHWALGLKATAAEVVRPPQSEYLIATGLTLQQPVFVFTLTRDHFLRPSALPAATETLHETGVIARRLYEARIVLGATAEEIGDAAGVSRASLFAWAKGTTVPRPPSRRGLDRIFGVTGVAVKVFGLRGAQEWFAEKTPSRAELILSGDIGSVAHELDQLLSGPRRGERSVRFENDDEPETLDEGR